VVGFLGSSTEWVKEFFIEKSWLFLRVLEKMWERASEEAFSVKRLFDFLGLSEGSLILDLGCGNGRIAINLAKLGYRVVGVDISPVFIKDAVEKAKIHGVEDRVIFRVGDARRIDEELGEFEFNAVLLYWSTILGYYIDESIDADILRRIRRITRSNGYLLVLNTVSYDLTVLRVGLLGTSISYFNEVDKDLVYVEIVKFDPVKSMVNSTWTFYKRVNRDFIYLDEISFKLRVYALHEIIRLAEENGWEFVNAYRDITTLTPYRPLLSGLNVVFKAK
jgi:SAM-dependent methyltransferase